MYQAAGNRYDSVEYRCSGRSGILLPRISLGLWRNFGLEESLEEQEAVLLRVSDMGTTYFDLINNYGFPAVDRAEEDFSSAPQDGLGRYRGELFISIKTGFNFWSRPYGNWGSRKYLMANLDSSLERMGLEYMDVFYHYRPDLETPLEETMGALSDTVHQGEALHVGIPSYQVKEAEAAIRILRENKTPYPLHQLRYNMSRRWAGDGLLGLLDREDVGCVYYNPLAQGILTGRYLSGIPEGSRTSKKDSTIGGRYLTENKLAKIRALNRVTKGRRQFLARMTLVWVLCRKEATNVLIGANSIAQLKDNARALGSLIFNREEPARIEGILKE